MNPSCEWLFCTVLWLPCLSTPRNQVIELIESNVGLASQLSMTQSLRDAAEAARKHLKETDKALEAVVADRVRVLVLGTRSVHTALLHLLCAVARAMSMPHVCVPVCMYVVNATLCSCDLASFARPRNELLCHGGSTSWPLFNAWNYPQTLAVTCTTAPMEDRFRRPLTPTLLLQSLHWSRCLLCVSTSTSQPGAWFKMP